MEPLYKLRICILIGGIITAIIYVLSSFVLEKDEVISDIRLYEMWERISERSLFLTLTLMIAGSFTFPFENLLRAIGEAINH
ncbi:hypothetical protein LIZ91_06430 [Enterococcus avium]|uniref:hypothetical protein n=1 Tax=Enterococcus avium TaxID=33945 RepID=UPI001D067DC1|nr:hypothetical protein [Enterococcus avium]MCB6916220.1 hypothetical protein [Enterococcus avium]MCQ4960076.1 hypothetical protein [Enterococcus avium]